jgi:hypothetical protein
VHRYADGDGHTEACEDSPKELLLGWVDDAEDVGLNEEVVVSNQREMKKVYLVGDQAKKGEGSKETLSLI